MEADRKAAAEKSETADKISAAELALKTADTVQASPTQRRVHSRCRHLGACRGGVAAGNFRAAQMTQTLPGRRPRRPSPRAADLRRKDQG